MLSKRIREYCVSGQLPPFRGSRFGNQCLACIYGIFVWLVNHICDDFTDTTRRIATLKQTPAIDLEMKQYLVIGFCPRCSVFELMTWMLALIYDDRWRPLDIRVPANQRKHRVSGENGYSTIFWQRRGSP
jgi:hypothetical protein